MSIPNETPFAPGNVPNRSSKVRFSLTTKTTCLIGVRVVNAFAFTNRGASGATVGVAEISRLPVGVWEARAVQADRTAKAIPMAIQPASPDLDRSGGCRRLSAIAGILRQR